MRFKALGLSLYLVCTVLLCSVVPASADPATVQTAWKLLDYIAVDYREAVEDGQIIDEDEYEEMSEFSESARERIEALDDSPARTDLINDAITLQEAIANKASPDEVQVLARGLATNLIAAYPVPLAPTEVPDVKLGATLYKQHCASCHGSKGDGLGPQSAGMDPEPIDFLDKERAQERSIFGLYQVVDQGLEDTDMESYSFLPEEERWALAFYVGTFAYPESDEEAGKEIWEADSELGLELDLEKLIAMTPADMVEKFGQDRGDLLTSYLRRNPGALVREAAGSLALSLTRLEEAIVAYEAGNNKEATNLALSAYLDGFEPIEPMVAMRDRELMVEVEVAMAGLRSAISKGASLDEVIREAEEVKALFLKVEEVIAPEHASFGSSFFGAFTILLREGLEALLIVVAMLGFLRKVEREDMAAYVHAGWIAALVCGVATWGVATWLITISGATREMTEGIGGVLAAFILLWVGVWMHGKSSAAAWQKYVQENVSKALSHRSNWFLFGLSFIVVYREAFETILFYAAIWGQGNTGAVLAGALTASVLLVIIAVAMLRFSKRLPIGKFFGYSSALIAILAVVLMGKGVAALQEAGHFSLHLISGFPRIDALGVYPTVETATAQLLMIGLLVLGFVYNTWSFKRLTEKA